MTVKPIPEGYPQVTPYLCVDGASAAIEFYGTVFGRPSGCACLSPTARSAKPSSGSAIR